MQRIWAGVGAMIGLAALALQFSLSIPAYLDEGQSLFTALVRFFSYFTIQTNIALLLIYTAFLVPARQINIFCRPVTRAMGAAVITLVMVFYHFVLAPTWSPEGMWWVADSLLHYVTPLIYVGWLVLFSRSGTLSLGDIPKMLAYPVIYVIYVMVRGALIGEYPYAIFAANRIGYPQVALNCLFLVIGLCVLFAIFIGLDRLETEQEAS